MYVNLDFLILSFYIKYHVDILCIYFSVQIFLYLYSGLVLVSTGIMQLVKLSACGALNGKIKIKR